VLADKPKLSLSLAAAALLGGGLGATSHAVAAPAAVADAPAVVSSEKSGPAPTLVSEPCLAQTICAVKERIRWQTPAWTPSQCRNIADAVNESAKRHDLSPSLLLAVMVNESDMNEKAARTYTRDGKIYAKDGGLMAIRCLLDDKEKCTNGNVRGVAQKPCQHVRIGRSRHRTGGAARRPAAYDPGRSGAHGVTSRSRPPAGDA